mgnify:FL=1|tara:strand:- start:11435 stop:12727 length:1293 start_codon:yes stop_codon:yes gene_type:complete
MTNKPKVLLSGPVCNVSGYSEHARTLADALLGMVDQIDLYIQDTQWSSSTRSLSYLKKYGSLIEKTNKLFNSLKDDQDRVNISGVFSCTYQVRPPNEFTQMSPNDIGVTAALETTFAPSEWVAKCNMMQHLLVVSEHAKKNIKNTKDQNGKGVSTPVTVVPFGYKENNNEVDVYSDINFTTSFNFLTVLQLAPRKNLEFTLKCFVDQFGNDSDVGLVIKTHMHNNSTLDFHATRERIQHLLDTFNPNRKCKIYFMHGNLTEDQMNSLYNPKYIDCYITATHGEGFGIPIFQAACNNIPVVATNWSGHLDFLRAPVKNAAGKTKLLSHFVKVDYKIEKVRPHHLMPGIITEECEWAYPKEESFRRGIQFVRSSKNKITEDAENLAIYLRDKFSIENIRNQYKEFNSIQIQPYIEQHEEYESEIDSLLDDLI